MKQEFTAANAANDYADIRELISNGEFAVVSLAETNPFNVYRSLRMNRFDCHCFCPREDFAVFAVMEDEKFIYFVNSLNALNRDKNIIMEYELVEKFVKFCAACGVNAMGGAFLDDGQVLYID